jgi:hypothetical protein
MILDDIVRTGLKTVNPERSLWTLAVFEDPEYPAHVHMSDQRLKDMLPGDGRILRLNAEQVQNLNPQTHHAFMLPPEEGFYVNLFDAIETYVQQGGILILTQGVPLYYAVSRNESGNWIQQGADESYRRRLHIGWEAWWTRKGVPKEISSLSIPERFSSEIHLSQSTTPAERFLTDSRLAAGDQFIPLLQAGQENYTGTAAAVFDLNSDLKGAVIASALKQDFRGLPEIDQAVLLPRAYLIALHSGVECMFWYNLRARENNPFYNEDHFGIVHRDLSPKPAYRAMQTLNRARPAGSLSLEGTWHHKTLYFPYWQRPDGLKGYALWSPGKTRQIEFKYKGNIQEIFDYLGNSVKPRYQNETVTIPVSAGPIYLIGTMTIELRET